MFAAFCQMVGFNRISRITIRVSVWTRVRFSFIGAILCIAMTWANIGTVSLCAWSPWSPMISVTWTEASYSMQHPLQFWHNMIRYDALYLRAPKRWQSQRNLPHGTKQKTVMKKTERKNRDAQKKRCSNKAVQSVVRPGRESMDSKLGKVLPHTSWILLVFGFSLFTVIHWSGCAMHSVSWRDPACSIVSHWSQQHLYTSECQLHGNDSQGHRKHWCQTP